MSGFEIAGIVLGALPILFQALDSYRGSFTRISQGIRKRKYVEKLARALRMQRQTLESIVKIVLLESGCESLPADDADIRESLNDRSAQGRVRDYLGEQNDLVFQDAIANCFASVHRATLRVATYVPSLKGDPRIQAIINANEASESIDLWSRISVIVNSDANKEEIKAIDDSIDALDRFTNILRTARQLEESMPSQKATRLAKSLRNIRRYTDNLYAAIAQCWQNDCHDHHEAKIFLDSRVEDAMKHRKLKLSAYQFRTILTCDPTLSTVFWHETAIHARDNDDATVQVPAPGSKLPKVTLISPSPNPLKCKMDVIDDLCTALRVAETSKKHVEFHLIDEKRIGMSLDQARPFQACQALKSVTLQELLGSSSHGGSPSLPLQARMLLALKLGSSFLQFLQTPWVSPCWSASSIHFLLKGQKHGPDVSHPYLSVRFQKTLPSGPTQQHLLKTALQELGILLLEIRHGIPFESKFFQQNMTTSPRMRLACALDWLDEVQNPLLDHYHTAVTNCVVRVLMSEVKAPDWDDIKVWRAVCEGIIEPLHKIVQGWSGGV